MEKKVAVIGAGAAGLVSARELLREGHRVVVFEKGKRIGGTWVYEEPKNGDPLGSGGCHSSIYKSLRTNLPRESMGFLDHPFVSTRNGDARRYPGHAEVLAYLEEFADRFQLLQHVRLLTTVSYVGLMENGSEWLVKSINNSGEESKEVFEAVVVCNGHYFRPRVAQIPGIERWPGKQYHSHVYRTPETFRDKVVAVIGNGPSGVDITSDIAGCCKHVHWCANSWDKDEPDSNISNISRHLMIAAADEDGTLHFRDGSSAVVDVILQCTGYLYDFPFLDTGNYLSVKDNRVEPLYKHVFPPALAPSLSFVGLNWKILPFPIFELQAKWIASVLSGRAALPSVTLMEDDTTEFYSRLEAEGVGKRYTHSLSQMLMYDYAGWLADASGSSARLEDWRGQVYANTRMNRKQNPEGYRDEWSDEDLYRKVTELLKNVSNPKS